MYYLKSSVLLQAAEAMDERAYWAAVLPDAVAGYDAQVRPPKHVMATEVQACYSRACNVLKSSCQACSC